MTQQLTRSSALDTATRTSTAGSVVTQYYLDACLRALRWAEARNYTGYSKFDALNSPLLKWLAGDRRLLRAGFIYLVSRAPFNIRPLLGVQKRQNPKGLALFARSYFNVYRLTGEAVYLDKGLALLEKLLELSQVAHYAGHCWGYDYDWETGMFFVPQYEPNSVVTVFVAQSFLSAYELTGNPEFLSVAASSTQFLRQNLNVTLAEQSMKSYSYTPFDRWTAINVNALIAALFASVFAVTDEQVLADETTALLNFLLDRQTDYGAWHHTDPPQASHLTHDNYHTGFVLDSLLCIFKVFGDDRVRHAYERGLDFYANHLFLETGAPKWLYNRTYPHDIHGCAQGILTFTLAASVKPTWLTKAECIADWTLHHMWCPTGRFYYQKTRFFTKRFTLMCWCQAGMTYALSDLVRACAKALDGS